MSGATTRAPAGAAIKIPAALMRQHPSSRYRAALGGHARNLAGTIRDPAANAIAVEHAQALGCDQLKTIRAAASPAAARRGAMTCTPTAAFVQGAARSRPARVPAALPAGQGARDTIIRRREREVRPRRGA